MKNGLKIRCLDAEYDCINGFVASSSEKLAVKSPKYDTITSRPLLGSLPQISFH
jgi:hypothetical protein